MGSESDRVELLGRHHPTIRRLRALRRDGGRRREEAVFLAEGRHLAEEALRHGAAIELVLTAPRLEHDDAGRRLVERCLERGLPLRRATAAAVDSVQDARSPQPVVVVVRRVARDLDHVLDSRRRAPLIVVADRVQDPGNLGGLLRTADAAGATGFVTCDDAADLFHPRAVRASAGSIFALPATGTGTEGLLPALRQRGIVSIATTPRESARLDDVDLTRPVALFLGREGGGLDAALTARLDERLHVPMRSGVDSLSVGAAAAVILFEAARQRARRA